MFPFDYAIMNSFAKCTQTYKGHVVNVLIDWQSVGLFLFDILLSSQTKFTKTEWILFVQTSCSEYNVRDETSIVAKPEIF